MSPTAIEWTEETWNPVTGCTMVSNGCRYCYAMALAARLKAMGNKRYQRDGGRASGPGFGVTLHPDKLTEPLRWKKPRTVFVNSMSDLFHEEIPDEYIDRVFAVMALTPQHTYQVLTKRPERMREYVQRGPVSIGGDWDNRPLWSAWPLPNVWLGVTAENQRWADERIPILLDTPAAVRFVSCEPLLGPIEIPWALGKEVTCVEVTRDGDHIIEARSILLGIDWVIVGGESAGPEKRRLVEPCQFGSTPDPRWSSARCSECGGAGWIPKPEALAWVRSLRDQCVSAGVAYFFKQWPIPPSRPGGPALLDGREWREYPNRRGEQRQ